MYQPLVGVLGTRPEHACRLPPTTLLLYRGCATRSQIGASVDNQAVSRAPRPRLARTTTRSSGSVGENVREAANLKLNLSRQMRVAAVPKVKKIALPKLGV